MTNAYSLTQSRKHTAKIATSRALASPRIAATFLALPVEILAMIMDEYYLMDLPVTPVMVVCRYMYDVIKKMPRIWRRILISLDCIPPDFSNHSIMTCGAPELLHASLERSRNSPLEATLAIGPIGADSPSPALRRQRFWMLMSHSHRISFLNLIINLDTPLHIIKDSLLGLFSEPTVFPALESLMITSAFPDPGLLDVFRPLMNQLERTSAKLRSVEFENMTRGFILTAREYKFWRKLSRIEIKGEHSPIHVTAFEGCDNLEFLSISGELLADAEFVLMPPRRNGLLGLHDPDDMNIDPAEGCVTEYLPVHPERKVFLPAVKELRVGIISMHALQNLHIPNARLLVITTVLGGIMYAAQTAALLPLRPIRLPALQALRITAFHSDIAAISAPDLRSLCLQVPVLERAVADHIVFSLFHGGEGTWAPKHLNIAAPIHDNQYEMLYKRVPTVETLKITLDDKPSDAFYSALKKRGILKNLLYLTIEFISPFSDTNVGANEQEIRTTRYPPLTESGSNARGEHSILWGGRRSAGVSDLINLLNPGTDLHTGGDGGGSGFRGGSGRMFPRALFLSDQVRPAMRELARVRAAQGLEFALLICRYHAENLEEVYAEKNICNVCRTNPHSSGRVAPNTLEQPQCECRRTQSK